MTGPLFGHLVVASVVLGGLQVILGCKDCVPLAKDEKSMFRIHSEACQAQAKVEPALIDALLKGEVTDDPTLKKHIYCVLLKCKVITKDGKLQKSPMFCKMSNKTDGKNFMKTLESCGTQQGDTPEDTAWLMFRCGYDKKVSILDYLPTHENKSEVENNTFY